MENLRRPGPQGFVLEHHVIDESVAHRDTVAAAQSNTEAPWPLQLQCVVRWVTSKVVTGTQGARGVLMDRDGGCVPA